MKNMTCKTKSLTTTAQRQNTSTTAQRKIESFLCFHVIISVGGGGTGGAAAPQAGQKSAPPGQIL